MSGARGPEALLSDLVAIPSPSGAEGASADFIEAAARAAGVDVERVGDCVAPRRAHAAVIDGERVGSAI